jgi:ornithine cyclodeaminase/alanine dehydrogenase-like protein (mu-crystallin family)
VMNSSLLRLGTDELWSALDDINPVDVLTEELIGRFLAGADSRPESPGTLTSRPETELAEFEDGVTGEKCQIPVSCLRMLRAATLATLAARALLAPGLVTAAVLGSGLAAQLQLAILARHVPDVSHVAVCGGSPIEPRVLDQLDLAGIGVSVTEEIDEAVLGSNLVIATGGGTGALKVGRLARGSVLVNAGGGDLPDEVVDGVDQVYVDDAGLIAANQHRYFVMVHNDARAPRAERPRRFTDCHRSRRIEADLGELLTGKHSGRRGFDDVLLVELLSVDTLDAHLTSRLHQAALDRGLGVRVSGQ